LGRGSPLQVISVTARLPPLGGCTFGSVQQKVQQSRARAIGVDFEVPDGGETIPLSGFAVVTGFFSVVASSLPSLFFVGALAPPSDSCGRQCL